MSQKHQIENIIKRYIRSNHTIGDRTGGSGHMGHVSFTIDEFNFKKSDDGNTEVKFKYTIATETEFTYYPDNPPGRNTMNQISCLIETSALSNHHEFLVLDVEF